MNPDNNSDAPWNSGRWLSEQMTETRLNSDLMSWVNGFTRPMCFCHRIFLRIGYFYC